MDNEKEKLVSRFMCVATQSSLVVASRFLKLCGLDEEDVVVGQRLVFGPPATVCPTCTITANQVLQLFCYQRGSGEIFIEVSLVINKCQSLVYSS